MRTFHNKLSSAQNRACELFILIISTKNLQFNVIIIETSIVINNIIFCRLVKYEKENNIELRASPNFMARVNNNNCLCLIQKPLFHQFDLSITCFIQQCHLGSPPSTMESHCHMQYAAVQHAICCHLLVQMQHASSIPVTLSVILDPGGCEPRGPFSCCKME